MADGRQAARQHGRGRVQARRPRPDLPQVHLRRLRGAARQQLAAERSERRRPRRPRRIPRRERLLGAARRPAGRTCRAAAKQPTHRQARRRRDGRHRARQPDASRACCPRTTPGPALDKHAARRTDRPDRHHRPRATRRAAPRTSSAGSTNISSRQFASAEGKKGGEFYTPRCVVRCWSRCSSRTRAASTTPAAARAACSCSREKFVEAHGGTHRRHLRSTARSRTTRPGGWPR